ncbi:DUF1284 domain-containing protein [Phyllobacterium zundukense]|nr:DUF1284 domain-containing protein [Phyllobacterium zundukense]
MLTYVGKGYSPAFTANYDKVVARLVAGEDIMIHEGPDDICQPLLETHEPHCLRDSIVERDAKAAHDVGQLLGQSLQAGNVIALDGLVLERFRTAFMNGATRSACTGCEWFDLCSTVSETGYLETRLNLC